MQPKSKLKQQPIFKDVMIDLETLGTTPGCSILSIGAVAFDPAAGQLGPEFYVVVNRENCLAASLHEDPDTIAWWEEQSTEARQVLKDAKSGARLEDALKQLTEYLEQFGLDEVRVWGNESDFDNAILSVCYFQVGQDLPWKFWHNRCYHTLKGMVKGPKPKRQGTYHNALDDAKTQALHAIQLMR